LKFKHLCNSQQEVLHTNQVCMSEAIPIELWDNISKYCEIHEIILLISVLTPQLHEHFAPANTDFWTFVLHRDYHNHDLLSTQICAFENYQNIYEREHCFHPYKLGGSQNDVPQDTLRITLLSPSGAFSDKVLTWMLVCEHF
jgi:hypothetical protein